MSRFTPARPNGGSGRGSAISIKKSRDRTKARRPLSADGAGTPHPNITRVSKGLGRGGRPLRRRFFQRFEICAKAPRDAPVVMA